MTYMAHKAEMLVSVSTELVMSSSLREWVVVTLPFTIRAHSCAQREKLD